MDVRHRQSTRRRGHRDPAGVLPADRHRHHHRCRWGAPRRDRLPRRRATRRPPKSHWTHRHRGRCQRAAVTAAQHPRTKGVDAMTIFLYEDGWDTASWDISNPPAVISTAKVDISGTWYDLDVDGTVVSIDIAGVDYDPAVTGGPPVVDTVPITGDVLARVAINGVIRTDEWIHLKARS